MIVTFDPMINTGASVDAAYMNFLRCVTAAATAAAGTTTLTVNPFTNNTGTIDSTTNCIVSIDSNTEAGGWSTSASHNVPNTGSFTAIGSAAAFTYKADFYNASGKTAQPYNKFTVHTVGRNTVLSSLICYTAASTVASPLTSQWSGFVEFTVGSSTSSDWTDTNYAVPSTGYYNQSPQNTSFTMNCTWIYYTTLVATRNSYPAFIANNTNVVYKIAVTANYCIVWEVPKSNSYLNGYSNTIYPSANLPFTNLQGQWSYGSLVYMGLREAQPWEGALNNNPPWCAFQAYHTVSNIGALTNNFPMTPNSAAAYLATKSNTGLTSSSATRYMLSDNYNNTSIVYGYDGSFSSGTNGTFFTLSSSSVLPTRSDALDSPLYMMRDVRNGSAFTNMFHTPSYDPDTGALVPPAHPIVFRRNTSDSWSPGGAARGIYKSLDMPWATMKNYVSDGQTFTIGSDTYMPVIFNETMYLIRKA
jgi:hypothetical protein